MTNIYIDIETAPTNDEEVIKSIRDNITPPGNYKKQESIEKWLEDNLESETDLLVRKTALDGLYGQIISIAWAIDDGEVNCITRKNYDYREENLLANFFSKINDIRDKHNQRQVISTWVGHYITGFDLRFIWQRCVINKVKPLVHIPYSAKPWDSSVFDTKVEWSGLSNYSGSSSLDKLSRIMLGHGKGEINGSNVFDYWKAGEIEKVAAYNKQDVEDCRKLYKLMNFIDDSYAT